MLSRRAPQNVLGISQQQTSARQQPSSSLSTNVLQLNNGTLPQGVNIKLTDDCYQNLQKAAQNGYEVLVHVNRKSITIEVKISNASSLKFDCYFQRVSGNVIHALCKSNNTFNDVANIAIRAQVKPTEQTFQTSRQRAANLSKHLEMESKKSMTQILTAPVSKPGERFSSFKNKTAVNRVGLPKSIQNPTRNGSSSLVSSSTLTSSSSNSNLNKLSTNSAQRGPKDYAALKQQVIHYIVCGRFKTQDEIVDHIISTGLPPGIPPESAKRKIREIICEVAEVYVNPPKISLLPKYHTEINIDWEYFSPEDRERVRQALSQTEVTAGNNFAPMRHSRRGPFVAPKAKTRKDPSTPAMSNSTTTSPDIASDASICSTPSPVNEMQVDNDDHNQQQHQQQQSQHHMMKPEKRKLSSSDLSKSMNSPLNDDIPPPPTKKRLTINESSNIPSSSKEAQSVIKESTSKSIPKTSSQSDLQKFRSSPYLKPVSSPQVQQNGVKSNERIERLPPKEHHKSRESLSKDKSQLYNGFTKAKIEDKPLINGSKISSKPEQSTFKSSKSSSSSSMQKPPKLEDMSKIKSESERNLQSEKTKALMELADESMKKLKEKEKKKEKVKAENHQKIAEEKVDKRDKNVESVSKLDIINGISTVEKKEKLEMKIEKQPKEKNAEKSDKHRNHHHHHHQNKIEKSSKEKSDGSKKVAAEPSSIATTIMTPKEETFKDPPKMATKEAEKVKSKKDKSEKERHSSRSNGKMAKSEVKEKAKEKDHSSETSSSKKDKKEKREKEHKKERSSSSSKTEAEIPLPKEKKVKTEAIFPKEKKIKMEALPHSTKTYENVVEKSEVKEKHHEKEKSKEKKEKSSKTKAGLPEQTKTPSKDAASLASEKLSLKPAEKLSKPVKREGKASSKESTKPLNPDKLTIDDIKKIKIQEVLKLLSDALKPSKSYESKYPPIRSKSDAEVYAKHELEYYELYEKAYNHLLNVQKDLSIYVERLNKAQSDQEKNKLEDKIRNYAARCLQDANFRDQRQTVANMTKAIEVLRKRQDDYYGTHQK